MTDPKQPDQPDQASDFDEDDFAALDAAVNGNVALPPEQTTASETQGEAFGNSFAGTEQNDPAASASPAVANPTGSPTPGTSTPYDELNPDVILDALESAGFEPNGSLLALNSFENRVYQVGLHDESFVVTKFYRPERWSTAQIVEEHDYTRELLDAELSVVAPLQQAESVAAGHSLFEHGGFQFAVFPRQGGHPPEIESEHNLAIMGRTLGRMHAVGRHTPHQLRPDLDWRRMAEESRDWLLASSFIPQELLPAYESVTEHLLVAVEEAMTRSYASIRLHGDCHLGNVLWRDDVPHFVDFDDTVNGPAIQDLWMLLSGERDDRSRQLEVLVEAYETFVSFDAAELGLIEALRTMRMMHHAAWIGRRWNDPAFPPAFPWFNGGRYWSDHVLSLREQLAAMEEPALTL